MHLISTTSTIADLHFIELSIMSAFRSSLIRSARFAATSSSRVAPRSLVAGPLMQSFVQQQARLLSTTLPRLGAGEHDQELSSRLAQEISYEQETAAQIQGESGGPEPAFLADFREAGIWKIEDVAGSDEIALTREFGNEHIRVLFSIGDIDTADVQNEMEDADAEEKEDEDTPSFPVRCAITISKVRLECFFL